MVATSFSTRASAHRASPTERLFEPQGAIDPYFGVVHKATERPTRDHGLKTLAASLTTCKSAADRLR
jgi:hypothetical protein